MKKIYQVSQDKTTSLITVYWVDEDPKFAASMLNHVVDKLNYYLENEYESDAKREREFVADQETRRARGRGAGRTAPARVVHSRRTRDPIRTGWNAVCVNGRGDAA